WKSGKRGDGQQTQGEKSEQARVSQPSGDVWCGNSWHDFGESGATTTRPAPGVRTKKRARSVVRGDGALREWSGAAVDDERERKTRRSREERSSQRPLHKCPPGTQEPTRRV